MDDQNRNSFFSQEEDKDEANDVVNNDLKDSPYPKGATIDQNNVNRFTTVKDTKYDPRASQGILNQVQYSLKIIMIGDISVGKTSVFNKFCYNNMLQTKETNLNNTMFTKKLQVDQSTSVTLLICDTSGEEQTRSIGKSFYKDVHGVLLFFDLSNKKTFDDLPYWMNEIKNHASEDTVVFLGGTKLDLKEEKQVQYKDAFSFAQRNQMDYLEISAFTGNNLSLIFELITSRIVFKIEEGGFTKQKNQNGRITIMKEEHIANMSTIGSNKKKCCK